MNKCRELEAFIDSVRIECTLLEDEFLFEIHKTKFSCFTLPPTQHHCFFRNYFVSLALPQQLLVFELAVFALPSACSS